MASSAAPIWVALACWALVGGWTYGRGCTLVADYLRAEGQPAVGRPSLTWLVLLVGAAALLVGHRHPGVPAVTVAAMTGTMSMLVDARTHRLPNALTLAMAGGVAVGLVCASLAGGAPGVSAVLAPAALGALIWTLPLGLGHLARAGVGLGDVKLAPVLGALTGLLGGQAAAAGLIIGFVSAGAAALVAVARRRADLRTRMPMGPWLIGGALAAWALWAVPSPPPV